MAAKHKGYARRLGRGAEEEGVVMVDIMELLLKVIGSSLTGN